MFLSYEAKTDILQASHNHYGAQWSNEVPHKYKYMIMNIF